MKLFARRHFSSASGVSAHRLVAQRVQGSLSLAPQSAPANTRVVFVTKEQRDGGDAALAQALPFAVSPHALREFKAKPQEKLYLYPSTDDASLADQRVVLVGLGEEKKVDENVLRNATHGAISTARAKRAKDVVVQLPALAADHEKLTPARVVEVLTQASMLSNYQFDKYLSNEKDDNGEPKLKLPLEQIFLDASVEFQQVRNQHCIL
jgi:leucyl aminopeptidase